MNSDIVSNIISFLPLSSLMNAMKVCKEWYKASQLPSLYTPRLLEYEFDLSLTTIKNPKTDKSYEDHLLWEWRNQIFCYWTEEYEFGSDQREVYIIKHHPEKTKSGILLFKKQSDFFKRNQEMKKEQFIKLYQDLKLVKKMQTIVKYTTFGTEAEYPFYPFILICDNINSTPLQAVCDQLEPHKETHFVETLEELKSSTDSCEKLCSNKRVKKFLMNNIKNLECAYIGAEYCNPFVVAFAGRGKGGNIVGLLTGGVYT